jgi:lysophospholipase L1-like esterase
VAFLRQLIEAARPAIYHRSGYSFAPDPFSFAEKFMLGQFVRRRSIRRHSAVILVSWVGALAAMLLPARCQAEEIAVKSGEKIAFLGDSITAAGAATPSGYVRLVISGLEANGVKAAAIPAGISGHKSNQMLERLQRDAISKKPDWMTLSCGVNDVWHGANGVPLDQYKQNITDIVDKAQAAGIKVVILTATMINEDAGNDNNKKLAAYNEFLRELARQKNCRLADLNADMQAAVAVPAGAPPRKGNLLTSDGVHMNPRGNQMMAAGVLRALGLNDAQLQEARDHWQDIPKAVELSTKASVSLRQYEQLSKLAESQNKSVQDLVNGQIDKAVEALLKPAN